MSFLVARDSREQKPWSFRKSEECNGMIVKPLATGDYTIDGHENLLSIERKGSVSEVANNLKESRFIRELVRLEQIKHSFVLMEFELQDVLGWPRNSGLSPHVQKKIKTSGPYIHKQITELMIKFPTIHWMFCGSEGQRMALSIIKRVYELELAHGNP